MRSQEVPGYYMLVLLLCFWPPGIRVAGQAPVPDSVPAGTVREYYVNAPASSTFNWWVDGAVQDEYSNRLTITWHEPGMHYLEVQETTPAGCTGEAATGLVIVLPAHDTSGHPWLLIPNAFTPNGDGLNDIFRPVFTDATLQLQYYNFTIYDQRGQLLFETRDMSEGWNGHHHGRLSALGSYMYIIHFKHPADNRRRRVAGSLGVVR
jgi:gliding motility-associated-like protein